MIKFETITGREVNLNIDHDATLGEIKGMLANQYNWDIQKIHLLFDGSEQLNNTKLSKINLENGKRFIVIYVEPSGTAPDVEDMINRLVDYNPDRQLCLEALQKNNYNIEQASEYLLAQIVDNSPPQSSNNLNKNSSQNLSIPQDGKRVQPDNNPFIYTPENNNNNNHTNNHNNNPFGLTDDEVKSIRKEKPQEMTDEVAFEIYISTNKDMKAFKELLQ